VMPAFVKKPASMDVCISRSFSFPDSYASIAHPLSESPSKDRVFQLRLFQPGFFMKLSLFYKQDIQHFITDFRLFFVHVIFLSSFSLPFLPQSVLSLTSFLVFLFFVNKKGYSALNNFVSLHFHASKRKKKKRVNIKVLLEIKHRNKLLFMDFRFKTYYNNWLPNS
jgi:hypothetical protein